MSNPIFDRCMRMVRAVLKALHLHDLIVSIPMNRLNLVGTAAAGFLLHDMYDCVLREIVPVYWTALTTAGTHSTVWATLPKFALLLFCIAGFRLCTKKLFASN